MMIRRELERKAYEQFISKGGKPTKRYPHYMTLGACTWLEFLVYRTGLGRDEDYQTISSTSLTCQTDKAIGKYTVQKMGEGMTTPPYPNTHPAVYNRENKS